MYNFNLIIFILIQNLTLNVRELHVPAIQWRNNERLICSTIVRKGGSQSGLQ